MRALLGALLSLSLWGFCRGLGAESSDSFVAPPPGETPLCEIGDYRVSWQSYGQPAVTMPGAWVGHFDSQSGISYQPWGRQLGRETLLMHSPWRVPPGKTRVDYPLALPVVAPIRLKFGIAMAADVVAPGKSDGVTFSCFLTVDGKQQELLRRHHDKAEWVDYDFDLASYAGRNIVLSLQVEPGPQNNASFDYSLFGDARLVIGSAARSQGDVVDRFTSAKAYRAVAAGNQIALNNTGGQGVTPSNLLPHANRLEAAGASWRFVYEGDDCRVVYTYTPATGTLDDFSVQVDDRPPFRPAAGGGVFAQVNANGKEQEAPLRGGKMIREDRFDDALKTVWRYDARGRVIEIVWEYRMRGKALVISAACFGGSLASRFSLGEVGIVPLRKTIGIPYLHGHVQCLPAHGAFVCRYLDWTRSHASRCPQGEAHYEPATDGVRNRLEETGYIAVSPDLGEVLPNLPHPASPYRELLGPRIVLDIWTHHRGAYRGDAENLRNLKDNGIDHLAIISHCWQRHGYDVKLPDHLPADPRYGGDEGMIQFGRAARECGFLWSLHENYIDMYPDAPSYDASARVLRADGSPSLAWYNPGTKVQSFGLKCNRAMDFARRTAPEIHRRYGTTAAYLDVHTCVPPWHQLDHEAGQPMAAMALAKVQNDAALFRFMREAHHGPLFGEGADHFYWAGQCDGVEAQVAGGEDHAALLDFDLFKLHPQMVNHGMGYYERWFRRGYAMRWGHDAGSMQQADKYRAQQLAYGHAGFVGNLQTDNVAWIAREHHLMHPVQRLYGAARATEIRYEVDGRWVTAGAAVLAGDTSRQWVRYDSGLTLWVNWRNEPWLVEGRRLPQWGFLARGPGTLATTELRGEHVADYAECPEFIFVDARTDPAVTGVKPTPADRPARDPVRPTPGRADFAAHLNSPGTFIDFGLAATDGSVKINREADRLVLFPYPRDKKFRVSLDMARLAPAANPQRVKVHVLAAGNCRDLGPAESRWERGRLTIDMGTAGAGRYVVEWPESANP